MTKKQFNSIVTLLRNGAKLQTVIRLVLDFCGKRNEDPSVWLSMLFNEHFYLKLAEYLLLKNGKGETNGPKN